MCRLFGLPTLALHIGSRATTVRALRRVARESSARRSIHAYFNTHSKPAGLGSAAGAAGGDASHRSLRAADRGKDRGVVINEAYLSGGSKGAAYKNKFIELYNTTDNDVTLDGTSLQYRPASGTGASNAAADLTGVIKAKGHYLIKAGSNGSDGAELPQADATATNLNASGTKGTLFLAATTSKLSPAVGDTTANADIIDQLKGLPNANREPLQSAIATLESRNSELAGALGNLDSLNTTIGNVSTDTAGLAQHLNTATQTTVREANTARGTITSGAIPQLNTGLNALSSTASTLSTGITSQGSLIDQSKHTLDQLDKAASTTVTALRDTDKALAGVQTKLDTLVTDIKALSISSSLSSLIGTDGKLDAATIADFMLSPTVISEQAVYPVASYGSGMAPLFTTLSLWVGAFVLVVIPKLETDDEGIDDLTPTQGYLGRFLLLATLDVYTHEVS